MPSVAEIFQTMEYGPAPESDKEALAWLERHHRKFGHFIDGEWTKARNHFEVMNPANSKLLANVGQGSSADVDAAVKAARGALGDWRKLSGHARARHIYALARAVQKHSRLLAVLETMDNGKSIRETRDIDIPLVARHFYHHAGWAQLLESEFPGYEGVGVAGQIIPWNFPLLMLAWKVAPALAAGCTIVMKPAEFTPLTALCFAEIANDAGLPPGVLNIVTGDGATGRRARRSPGRRQDRVHRLDRSRPDHSQGDGRLGQEALARAGRQEPVHRLRGRGSRQRRRRRRRRDLVQPGAGVLRRLAPARAGGRRRPADREAARADGEASPRLAARQGGGHGRDRRAGAARADPVAGAAGERTKARRCGSRRGPVRRKAASIRRRCSRTCSRRRRSRRSRSSDRCS